MDDQRHRPESKLYPAPPNRISQDPTPKEQAVYVPSVTPSYAIAAYEQNWKRALPRDVDKGDLNFLDPNNKLIHLSHVMSSAGQALNQKTPCIVTTRDRNCTVLIGDSGGFQIAHGSLNINSDKDVLKILRWQEEHADYAMTLDVPTGFVGRSTYKYKNMNDCLQTTLQYLDLYQQNRASSSVSFLNVLQGNTVRDADIWYDTVKPFEFEGWAFAGPLRHNFFYLCRRIIIMADEGQIQNKKWIHVLGTCELFAAVLLTTLQRAINRHINPNLRISFDTSSPTRSLSYGNIYTLPKFNNKKMTMQSRPIPDDYCYIECDLRWPWPSPLGDRMVMGDVCVQRPITANRNMDTQSAYYLAHHNLSVLCSSIALANRIFDSENIIHSHSIAAPVGAASEAIDDIIAKGTLITLQNYQSTFAALPHGNRKLADDEDRSYLA